MSGQLAIKRERLAEYLRLCVRYGHQPVLTPRGTVDYLGSHAMELYTYSARQNELAFAERDTFRKCAVIGAENHIIAYFGDPTDAQDYRRKLRKCLHAHVYVRQPDEN